MGDFPACPGPGRSRWPAFGRLLGAAFAGLLLAGCASGGGGEKSPSVEDRSDLERPPLSEANQKLARGCLSAVLISGNPRVTVIETVESVYTEAGFTLASKSDDSLVFERPATRKMRMAYGTWSGDESRLRLQVDLYQEGTEEFFVRCRSFIARGAGSPVEDQQSLARRQVREYEGLLDEVATRLD